MMIPVDNHIAWFGEQWKWTSNETPQFHFQYSLQEKALREKYTNSFYNLVKELQYQNRGNTSIIDLDKIFSGLVDFLKNVYDFPSSSEEIILNRRFFEISKQFYKSTRNFDPSLTPEEIYQALRNVWIMNGIQLLLDLPLELTPSILAYSLLYPYSDNLLDDPSLSGTDKFNFSNRFEARLKGIPVAANDTREEKISRLVALIEEQYPRNSYPDLYDSLLAIHTAQTRSILLQQNTANLTREQVLKICFDKGGTSVVADGYLVAGNLTPLQQRFLFGYGVWLQLADDIHDIEEDNTKEMKTLFSLEPDKNLITENLNRTFHFGRTIINDIGCFPSDVCIEFGKIMVHAIEIMVMQAAGLNSGFFAHDSLCKLENYSPIGFGYLRKMRKKGSPQRMKLVSQMIQMLD